MPGFHLALTGSLMMHPVDCGKLLLSKCMRGSLWLMTQPNEPKKCACRGLAPQMREHTASHCSVLKTEEVNELMEILRKIDEEKKVCAR